MSVLGWLGVLFVALKLTGFINWSWWLVTLPFWGIYVALFLGVIVSVIFKFLKKNK